MSRVKYLSTKSRTARFLYNFPNFHKSGSIKGMKQKFYGKHALLVRSGNYIYNVTGRPDIYDEAK